MSKKRIGILMICACLLVGSLSGCGGWKKTSAGMSIDTVTIWSPNAHSKSVVERLVEKFNQTTGKAEGIRIEYRVKPSNTIRQELEAEIKNGAGPDLFATGDLISHIENGYVLAIEDLPGGRELVQAYEERSGTEAVYHRGKAWTMSTTVTTQGLIYNKEMFEKAGIVDENGEAKPPETLEELRETAKRLTNPDKMEYGMILPLGWTDWTGSDVISLAQVNVGHSGFNVEKGEYDYSDAAPIMNTYLQMQRDGSIYPGGEEIDNDQARALFAAGDIGMKIGFSFDVGVLNVQFPADFSWGVAPLPVADKDCCYQQPLQAGGAYYINVNALNHIDGEKLTRVIEFFASKEYLRENYRAGVDLPREWKIIENVKPEEHLVGWQEFCNMVQISEYRQTGPIGDRSSVMTEKFLKNVWTGKQTPEEMLAEFTQEQNELLRQYRENPANPPVYTDPDWDIRRKTA